VAAGNAGAKEVQEETLAPDPPPIPRPPPPNPLPAVPTDPHLAPPPPSAVAAVEVANVAALEVEATAAPKAGAYVSKRREYMSAYVRVIPL